VGIAARALQNFKPDDVAHQNVICQRSRRKTVTRVTRLGMRVGEQGGRLGGRGCAGVTGEGGGGRGVTPGLLRFARNDE
jgi:hypothetical protein